MGQTQINQVQPSLPLWNIPQITIFPLNPFMDLVFTNLKKKTTLLLLHKIELYFDIPKCASHKVSMCLLVP